MLSAAAVVLYALDLLGRSVSSLPPIELVDIRPSEASANAEAFVRRNPDAIHVITSTQTFRDAQHGDPIALRKLASILVHEEWHLRHGSDEHEAYLAQLMTLRLLGSGPGTALYHSVWRSMMNVLHAERKAEGATIAPAPRASS